MDEDRYSPGGNAGPGAPVRAVWADDELFPAPGLRGRYRSAWSLRGRAYANGAPPRRPSGDVGPGGWNDGNWWPWDGSL